MEVLPITMLYRSRTGSDPAHCTVVPLSCVDIGGGYRLPTGTPSDDLSTIAWSTSIHVIGYRVMESAVIILSSIHCDSPEGGI